MALIGYDQPTKGSLELVTTPEKSSECPLSLLPANPVTGKFGVPNFITNETGAVRNDSAGGGTFRASRANSSGYHGALDLAGVKGVTPVRSIGDGKVVSVGYAGKMGLTVTISHGSVESQYGHLHPGSVPSYIKPGAHVSVGQRTGRVGTTGNGNVPVPHLHLIIKVNGVRVDPKAFLNSCPARDY
jgi:murein DD-endopeptidase MepM/ murein hydrolase activator NlpD